MTNEAVEKMDEIVDNKSITLKEVKKKTVAIQTKIKSRAFGKAKPSTERARLRRLATKDKVADELDGQARAKALLSLQSKMMEDKINNVKSLKYGRAASVFKMREEVAGCKKKTQE